MAGAPFSEERPYESGARRALELRIGLGLGDEPIPDLWAVVRQRGVHLALHEFGENGGDGLYVWNGADGLIVANASQWSRLRLRFTVAHELAHHELHRPEQGRYLHADKDIFGRRDPIEQEANAFAGHLLLPDPALARALLEWQVLEFDDLVVARLMQRFGVSYETAVYRLNNSGKINAGTREYLLQLKQTKGVRSICAQIHFNEALAFPLPSGWLPEAFETDVLQAYAGGGLGQERLSELLQLPVSQAVQRARDVGIGAEEGDLSDEEFEALLDADE